MEVTETVNYCSSKNKFNVEPPEKNITKIPLVIEQLISDLIKDEGFIKYEVSKNPFSTGGGNYLGDLFEVDVKGKTKDGDKKISVIIKMKISVESMNDFMNISSLYSQELTAYTSLLKTYNNLQNEADIPDKERFKMAKCYPQSNDNAIILENLSRKGFNLLHRMDTMSLEFAKKSIQQLSKFHSLSIVLEKKKPKDYQEVRDSFTEAVEINEEWLVFCKSIMDTYLHMFDEDIQKRVLNFHSKMLNKMEGYMTGTTASLKCFTHGDYRINNILKKEIDGEVVELIPIDYQFIHPRSPVLDIIYLIYSATDRKFRKQHLQDLLDVYHDTMKDFLSYFNLDVDSIYSKNQFLKDFFEFIDFGLIISLYVLPLCFVNEENIPDLNNYDKSSVKLNERLRDRLGGVFNDFIELGIL